MTLASAASLLHELRERGVYLEVVGDRLRFRPVDGVPPDLRQQLAAAKPAILDLLHQEAIASDAGDGPIPSAARCSSCLERDFVRPRAGGTWRCARCQPYDLPGAEVEWWPSVQEPAVSLDSIVRVVSGDGAGPCRCCGSAGRWRRKTGGPWVCSLCHPPLIEGDLIETVAEEVAP